MFGSLHRFEIEAFGHHQIFHEKIFTCSVQTYIRYLNERGEVHECYSYLKLMIQTYLHSTFLYNMFYLNDSFDLKNYSNRAQILSKDISVL